MIFVGSGLDRQWAARELIRAGNNIVDRTSGAIAMVLYGMAAENLAKALLIVRANHGAPGMAASAMDFVLFERGCMDELIRATGVDLSASAQRGLQNLAHALAGARSKGAPAIQAPLGTTGRADAAELLNTLELALKRTGWIGAGIFEETDLMGLK